jgi:hypothetical protein
MSKARLTIIITAIVIFFAALGIYFTVSDNSDTEINTSSNQDMSFTREDIVQQEATPEYFESFGTSKLKVVTYGGVSDIKTALINNKEYALIRNPKNTIDFEFYKSDSMGEYYFAEFADGSRLEFTEGTPEGKFGYLDFGEVSKINISERNSSTEYYASYPSQELAKKYGFVAIRDDAVTNNFLSSRYLKITNLNNNRSVITEIDSRNSIEDTLYISEATRRGLMIDNNALGSFSLEIVDKENNTLGVVRL